MSGRDRGASAPLTYAQASAEHRHLSALISAQRRLGRAVDPVDAARLAELGRLVTRQRRRQETDDARRVREILRHVCGPSCGPVCTFGDW